LLMRIFTYQILVTSFVYRTPINFVMFNSFE
jgi:hypothetical protein